MRSVVLSVLTLAALALGGTALAGDCELSCPNQCPLAKSANALRADGSEAVRSSAVVRQDVRREVHAALERV